MALLSPRSLDKIGQARLSLREQSTLDSRSLTFYPSIMCHVCLPTETQPGTQYYRRVGRNHLNIMVPQAGPGERPFLIPYGIYARGVLWYIAQESVRAKKQEREDPLVIKFGDNLSKAVERITGKNHSSGGPKSPREILERQLLSLSAASINFRRGSPDSQDFDMVPMQIASRYQQRPLWKPQLVGEVSHRSKEITLRLNQEFYDDIIAHAVPIDERIMRALWPSCLQVDLYTWITYRANDRDNWPAEFLPLSWRSLIEQFGSNYSVSDPSWRTLTTTDRRNIRSFKQKFREAIKIIRMVYDPNDIDCIRLEETGERGNALKLYIKHTSVQGVTPTRGYVDHQMGGSTGLHITSRGGPHPPRDNSNATLFQDLSAAPAPGVCKCGHDKANHFDNSGRCVLCWQNQAVCREYRNPSEWAS